MIAIDNKISQVISSHKSGKAVGITSVCSANNYVIKAAIQNAKKNDQTLLIESTSNQVDQFGGYTGLTPAQFMKWLHQLIFLKIILSLAEIILVRTDGRMKIQILLSIKHVIRYQHT